MELILAAVLVVLIIAAAAVAARRVGLASPLILLAVGLIISWLPFTPEYVINPEVILAGLLPPLLYSAAVNMPTMDFRRDFRAISGMSVVLVIISALILGWVFMQLIDGLDYPMAVALGAIVSPTDAVATSIAKRLGVAPRVTTVLEGESLFNDATALVLLRSAVAATAAGLSLAEIALDFLWAVVGAVVIGWFVGQVILRVRRRIKDVAVSTAVSFTVPFLAFVPAEHWEASGLVAAVTAGLVMGRGQALHLGPQQRLSDHQNWRTIELLLEGLVFLIMGLEVSTLVRDVGDAHGGVWHALVYAVVALMVAMVIRAVYVASVVLVERRRLQQAPERREVIDQWSAKVQNSDHPRADLLRTRLRRASADVDYYDASRFGRREGVVLVWAGLRGAVTLAAAQTLPTDVENRSLLILVAFSVALLSLVVQGGTLGWLVRFLGVAGRENVDRQEWERLNERLHEAAQAHVAVAEIPAELSDFRDRLQQMSQGQAPYTEAVRELRLQIINAQREVLLSERADGTFASDTLTRKLAQLDADQIGIELRQVEEQ